MDLALDQEIVPEAPAGKAVSVAWVARPDSVHLAPRGRTVPRARSTITLYNVSNCVDRQGGQGSHRRGRLSLWRRLFLLICGILAAAGVLAPVVLALFGSENHLLSALKDDGFYFLGVARNFAAGHGATFDCLGPTNGFHPLWVLLLTPIFWITQGSLFTPIRIMLLLATVLHLAAGIVVYRSARVISDRPTARLASLFFLGNPLVVYLIASGMESPLVALLVSLLVYESIKLRRGRSRLVGAWPIVRLGILCGLTILARTDLVLLVGLVLAGAAFLIPGRGRPSTGSRLWGALLAGLVAVLVAAPWAIWNLVRFGTLVQVSARAHHLHSVAHQALNTTSGDVSLWKIGPSLLVSLFDRIVRRTLLPEWFIFLIIVAIAGVFITWLVSLLGRPDIRRDFTARLRSVDAPLVYAAGFLFAAFFVLGHIRSWYLAGPLAVFGVLLAFPAYYAFTEGALQKFGRILSGLIFAGIVAIAVPLWFLFGSEIDQNSRNTNVWSEASEWVVQNTEPDERVASFNTGTFGYLTPRTVINLDCVINNRAIPWLERGELLEYLRRDHIRYVIDDPTYAKRYLKSYAGPDWEESVVALEDLPAGLRVYSVR